jgi:hypothetical protein
MTSDDRRRELRTTYERRPREAGVYLLRNRVTGRILVASSPDLRSVRNRLDFGRATETTGVLDRRMVDDARDHGMASIDLEVLDVLEDAADRPDDEVGADLRALEALWREKLADQAHY